MPQRVLNDDGDCSSKNNNEDIFTWQITGASEKLLLLIQIGYVAKPKFQGGGASVPADLKEAYVNNYKIVIQEYICYHVGN